MPAPIRTWLKQSPVPYKFVADYDDGGTKTVRMGDARSKFRDAETALKGALRIEALDRDGSVLRVWEASDATEREAAIAVKRGDDTMGMLTQVARLLVESADAAAERHGAAYQLAYQQQTLLVTTVTERLASLERVLHEQLMQRTADIAEQEEELAEAIEQAAQEGAGKADDPNTGIVMGLLQGALMNGGSGGASAPNSGKGNAA